MRLLGIKYGTVLRVIYVVLVVVIGWPVTVESNVGFIEMAKMVATSGLCFTADLWKNYGCYCGLGSRCTRPIDCLDSCCEQHDKCYGDLEKELHPDEGYVLLLGYNWREEAGHIDCDDCSKVADDFNANFIVGPRSLQNVQDLHILQSCRKCLCDKKLTMCLRGKPCPVEGKNHSDICPPTSDLPGFIHFFTEPVLGNHHYRDVLRSNNEKLINMLNTLGKLVELAKERQIKRKHKYQLN